MIILYIVILIQAVIIGLLSGALVTVLRGDGKNPPRRKKTANIAQNAPDPDAIRRANRLRRELENFYSYDGTPQA